MKNSLTPAAELAANFQVSELEPRLENAWTNMSGDPGPYEPACGDGSMPGPGGTC